MQDQSSINPQVVTEILGLCLEALDEAKSAYHAANQQQARVIELEKVAATTVTTHKLDTALVQQTIRNLVASSFLDAEHSEKLASEIQKDPSVALRLVQRFIEISTPPFSEGQGVQKNASEETNLGDPDGWARVISKGA
jgi:hypothetical protein